MITVRVVSPLWRIELTPRPSGISPASWRTLGLGGNRVVDTLELNFDSLFQTKAYNPYGDKVCLHNKVNGEAVVYPDQVTMSRTDAGKLKVSCFSRGPVGKGNANWTLSSVDEVVYFTEGGGLRTTPWTSSDGYSQTIQLSSVAPGAACDVHIENSMGVFDGSLTWGTVGRTGNFVLSGKIPLSKRRKTTDPSMEWSLTYTVYSVYNNHPHQELPTISWNSGMVFKLEAVADKCLLHTVGAVNANSLRMHADGIVESLDNAKSLSGNNLSFLRDLANIRDLARPLRHLWRKPPSAKKWADIWLNYRYGITLFASDVQSLYKDLTKRKRRNKTRPFVLRAGSHDSVVTETGAVDLRSFTKVYCRGTSLEEDTLWYELDSVGFAPSPSVLWDFVPYSFVVDWFLPVSSILEGAEASFALSHYQAISSVFSTKGTQSQSLTESHLAGSFDIVVYHREVDNTVALRTLPLWARADIGSGLSWTHVGDNLALLVQRRK